MREALVRQTRHQETYRLRKFFCIVAALWLALTAAAVPPYRGAIFRTANDGTEQRVWLDGKQRAPRHTLAAGEEPNAAPRGLIILVNFKDTEFQTPRDTIDSLLNGLNFSRQYTYRSAATQQKETITANGSARQYFYDQSYGAYNPQFDVVGPFNLSKDVAYYGEKVSGTNDARAYIMIKEACEMADADGVDFRNYDHNNDGTVDFVFVLYAGYGEADSGIQRYVWPHASDLSTFRYRHDGKYIGRYACSGEMNYTSKVYNGIGTFCHEFSHVLGLPDLYDTSENEEALHTLYDWDIMDYGCYNNDGNTPPAYSAYERFYMGWLTPRLLVEPEDVTLHPINDGEGEALVITYSDEHPTCGWDPNPTIFYLLEARYRTGWDKHIPGPGMLITRIEYNAYRWRNNAVNSNARSMGVDLIEAKENTDYYGKYTDTYPAGANSWKEVTDHYVTSIKRNATTGNVTFRFRAEEPQGVESVQQSAVSCQKIIRDGQLILLRGEQKYDILGRRL